MSLVVCHDWFTLTSGAVQTYWRRCSCCTVSRKDVVYAVFVDGEEGSITCFYAKRPRAALHFICYTSAWEGSVAFVSDVVTRESQSISI